MVDIRTILLSLMTLIVVGIVIIIIYELTYGGGITSSSSSVAPWKTSVELVGNLHEGRDYLKLDKDIPKSQNEREGIEFSYAAWIVVNDYDEGSAVPV
ncbi:hypothetical protein EB118_21095, partial [bacterium]|nr:hypothetical protein [bacterium]